VRRKIAHPVPKKIMQELDYPSGPWTGFYHYGRGSKPSPMDLFLDFSGGGITGEGQDEVGGFVIAGGYTDGGECRWTKSYPGSHEVSYRGFREGKGIWGLWEIRFDGTGGFHIWPLGADGVGEEAVEATEQEAPTPPRRHAPAL
jgi:hypothetical protein